MRKEIELKKINSRGTSPPSPFTHKPVLFSESENRVPEAFSEPVNPKAA